MTKIERRLLKKLKLSKSITPDLLPDFSREEFKIASLGLQNRGLAWGVFVDQENGMCIKVTITDMGMIYKAKIVDSIFNENIKWLITVLVSVICALIAAYIKK